MLGAIERSGLYALEGIKLVAEYTVIPSFGKPSVPIVERIFVGQTILFLPQHGRLHELLPHEGNYLANVSALKEARH
jgi:5'-methylthioadenosine phosphorylase